MAYSVPEGAIAEVQYRYTIAEQQCINTFFYKTPAEILDAAAWILSAITEKMDDEFIQIQSYQTSEVTNIHVRGQWVYPTRYVYEEYRPADGVGGAAPPALSIGTCLVFRRRSELASRSSRGRIYIGGIEKAKALVGQVDPMYQAELNTNIGAVVATGLTNGAGVPVCPPVVWSYSDPTHADEILTVALDPYLRYQRRREVGRGQ